EVAGRDDPVRVDVISRDVDGPSRDAGDLFECHWRGWDWVCQPAFTPNTSRASATAPLTAAAATMTGLMRIVRPVGLPWRPLKFRFDELAQSWSPTSLSGFMARHMEHPALRHSNPASRKTLSMPSSAHSRPTPCEPGTAIALMPGATRLPLMRRATSWKSLRRPFVHEPRKATSILVPLIGAPGLSFM